MKLNKNDYISILQYYNIHHSDKSLIEIKNLAEEIIADKLCSCIKKVKPETKNESRAIAICRSSIINKKGFKINRFTCKKKTKLFDKKYKISKNKKSKISKNKIFK